MMDRSIETPAAVATEEGKQSASWQARWVELLLRTTVKRSIPPDVDLVALRRQYEEADRRKFSVPPDVPRTPVDAGGRTAAGLRVPGSPAGRFYDVIAESCRQRAQRRDIPAGGAAHAAPSLCRPRATARSQGVASVRRPRRPAAAAAAGRHA